MRKLASLVLCLSLLLSFSIAKADEGMWLLSLLKKQNAVEMQKMGFKLSAEDIYDINNNSMKDAIVGLGNEGRPFRHFCTGEIISDQGLFLTNHHCGFPSIQSHSTTEHDYLADGFWAYNKGEELTNEGLTASIMVRMEDVSKRVLATVNDEMTEDERFEAINKVSAEIVKETEANSEYKASVKGMFEGNQYFLFVYEIFQDVRLVGAPPQAMGKFGGDTDNWMWPRHTADFSMFRIYTDANGKPAKYSADNIPLKPRHHLPVSIKGNQENDFAMIMGFPGTTNRYLTSFGLEETMNITNKNRYDIRTVKLDVMMKDMLKDPKVRIQYASKHAGSANYWKYSNEQNKALKKLNTMGAKQEIEAEYTAWANKKKKRAAKYGDALNMIEKAYTDRKESRYEMSYLSEALLQGAEMYMFAYKSTGLMKKLSADSLDQASIDRSVEGLKGTAKAFYKDYNLPTDQKLLAALFAKYAENIEPDKRPDIFKVIAEEYNNDFAKFAADVYSKSIFASEESYNKFLENPTADAIANDMGYEIATSIIATYRVLSNEINKGAEGLSKGKRLFVDGLMQINKKQNLAPDANSTLRLTYGKVGGYSPKDGVYNKYYTTLKGVMEKEDSTSYEFNVPARLKELYKNKDFGQYADKDGSLHTCFLTNSDITGGNSGSPVINGNGELIGAAFDGNSEAMSGDIDFEDNLQRCINLDIRYALFIIDKYAGAKNLIDEMTIVK
ncbi:S46 family peptidase [Ancylomarina sp. 16SWW S1-10-2]|uniref:S46 family peptidase n=1 Tax=Ancylomarina sp. 16SWW S1-10-2 TaxID=2499681 RepID=UPI0012AD2630|nr:S46 family peptidase [Ancylomarina sp. 16SWW S1-10-2]MRT92370.1 S46 family peptidase [Ancylomarina sp. 16SWW S1-10-2]